MEINRNPSLRQVSVLSLTSLGTLPLALAAWSRGSMTALGAAAATGIVIALTGLLRPHCLRPTVAAANVATSLLVAMVHEAALWLAFCLVFVPVGLAFRLIGRDALQLRIDRGAATYWQAKKQPGGARSYFRRW
jgi:hypothetical protein